VSLATSAVLSRLAKRFITSTLLRLPWRQREVRAATGTSGSPKVVEGLRSGDEHVGECRDALDNEPWIALGRVEVKCIGEGNKPASEL
jgi:hypothetical protein